jgi:hypothetical protein
VSIRKLRSSPFGLLLFLAAVLICCAASGVGGDGLLCLAPALALAGVLVLRRYPGERLLLRLRAPRRSGRSRAGVIARPSASGHAQRMPRGGLLMGFALAVRPPPLSFSAG